jgi:hypothetical protein
MATAYFTRKLPSPLPGCVCWKIIQLFGISPRGAFMPRGAKKLPKVPDVFMPMKTQERLRKSIL